MTRISNLEGDLTTQLDQELSRLRDHAMSIVDQYWAWRTNQHASRPFADQSRMALRVHDTQSGSFQVEWYAFRWVKTKKGNKHRYISIKKGTGDKYPRPALAEYAREWELDQIVEIDEALATVRRAVKALGKARMAIRLYCKLKGPGHTTPDPA